MYRIVIIAILFLLASTVSAAETMNGDIEILPVERQIRLALDAAPPPLRAEAGIWILEKDGYREHRKSKNGIECLVDYEGPGTLAPTCWDPEGARTIMAVVLERARLRGTGLSSDQIDTTIERGFGEGRFRAPERPGVAYMLSPENLLPTPGGIRSIPPHYMFYAPNMTDADIGGGHGELQPFIINEGSPHAYIIVWADPKAAP